MTTKGCTCAVQDNVAFFSVWMPISFFHMIVFCAALFLVMVPLSLSSGIADFRATFLLVTGSGCEYPKGTWKSRSIKLVLVPRIEAKLV